MRITETAAIAHFVNVNFVTLGRATGRVQMATASWARDMSRQAQTLPVMGAKDLIR